MSEIWSYIIVLIFSIVKYIQVLKRLNFLFRLLLLSILCTSFYYRSSSYLLTARVVQHISLLPPSSVVPRSSEYFSSILPSSKYLLPNIQCRFRATPTAFSHLLLVCLLAAQLLLCRLIIFQTANCLPQQFFAQKTCRKTVGTQDNAHILNKYTITTVITNLIGDMCMYMYAESIANVQIWR